MPPRLSIVLPVLNEAASLPGTLARLRRHFPEAELLVVDGGSSDETVALAAMDSVQVLHSQRGRARQMNTGAAAARGDYLLFLHADSEPGYTAADLYLELAAEPAWGFAPVILAGRRWVFRVIEHAISWRSRLTRVATGDQGIFVLRSVFEDLGGYADIPLMEDVELSKRLRSQSAPRVLPWPVTTSSRRWESHGVLRTILTMWRLRLAYVCGVPPQRLYERYYG